MKLVYDIYPAAVDDVPPGLFLTLTTQTVSFFLGNRESTRMRDMKLKCPRINPVRSSHPRKVWPKLCTNTYLWGFYGIDGGLGRRYFCAYRCSV